MQLRCTFYSAFYSLKQIQTIFPLQRTSMIRSDIMFCPERRHLMFPLRGMLSQLTRCTSVQNLGSAKHCDKSKRRRKNIDVGRWTQTITGGRVWHRFWLFLLCEGNACNTTDIVFRLVVMKVKLNKSIFLKVQMISSGPFLLH